MQKWYDMIKGDPGTSLCLSHDAYGHTQGFYQEKTCCDKSVNAAFPKIDRSVLTVDAESTAVDTLQGQFSGYGSTSATVARCLDRIGLKEPLEEWSDEKIERVVQAFIDEKFPTVFALNKIDHPDADKVGSFFNSWNHARIRAERNNLEYQQDRQDARSKVNSAMLRDIRGFSSKIGETGLHQVYRRQ